MLTQDSISRKKFLMSLGISGGALMAILQSCTNENSITPSGSTVDLSTSITAVGSYLYVGSIIVTRIASGNTAASFVALAKACTHEGTSIIYSGNGVYYCPNHGAKFNASGAVTLGPASRALTKYTVTVTGTSLTVA